MRASAPSVSVSGGGLRACLLLSAVLLASLLVGPGSSEAAVSAQGFPVSTNAENETSAAVSGNTAVWAVSRAGSPDIAGKNLSTGGDLDLPSEPGAQIRPSVSGRVVVWEDLSSGGSDVYGYDLVARQKFPVAVGPGNQTRPSVAGRTVVWEDDRGGDRDVYRLDLDTGQESPVVTAPGDQRNPAIGGGAVAWEERDATDSDVVVEDLATGRQRAVASGSEWQDSPAVGDGTVVWREENGVGDYDVRGYDLDAGRPLEAVAGGPADQYAPAMGGRVVVWVHNPGGNADVRGMDLSTGESFVVAGGPGQQENPAVSGETAIWEVQREGDDSFGTFDLFGARLDLAPVAPAGLVATASAEGVALDWRGNAEADLAGYNVYRAASEGGEYAKLNAHGPIPASSFNDAGAPKGVRSYYRVTAVDAAGSESAAARANAVVPQGSEISLESDLPVLEFGGTPATLTGRLTSGGQPLADKTVVLEARQLGAVNFAPVVGGQLTTDATGGFSLAGLRPTSSADYRARFVSDAEELLSSESPLERVDVKQLVSLNVSTTTLKLGRALSFSGTVFPADSGTVTLTIKRAGSVVGHKTVAVSGSRFSLRYRPPTLGYYEVSATLTGYPSSLVTTGPKRFRVVR